MRQLLVLLAASAVWTMEGADAVQLPAVGKVMYEFNKDFINMTESAAFINEIQTFEGTSTWPDCNAMCSSLLYGGTQCNFFYIDDPTDTKLCKVCYVANRPDLVRSTKDDGGMEVRILNVQKAVVDDP